MRLVHAMMFGGLPILVLELGCNEMLGLDLAESTGASGAQGGSGSANSGSESGASISSSEGGSGSGKPCSTGCPDGFWDVDGNPITGTCGCEYACTQVSVDEDPIDPNFTDDNCDGGDGLVERCVYVSVSEGDDMTGDGTRQSPVQTIAQAIQMAQSKSVPAVCLSGEVYDELAPVQVASGVSIYGGFNHQDPDFKFRRAVTTTVIAKGTVFNAAHIDQETHIAGITITARSSGMPGSSTYGVRLGTGMGRLFVRDNWIDVEAGEDGANGADGQPYSNEDASNGYPGAAGAEEDLNSGFGGPAPVCGAPGGKGGDAGVNQMDGLQGNHGSGGMAGGSGGPWNGCTLPYDDPGPPGGFGQNGTSSNQGTPGMGGGLGQISWMLYSPANGGSGLIGINGKGGGGGGGGGGGSSAGGCNWSRGGGGGSGGCGGLGGNFGFGGGGGGGSFGVFAASGKVVVTGNSITTHKGGDGGDGGDGAQGQFGGIGGLGGPSSGDSGPGGKGGNGGKGGSGGPGGGGGGGPSACLGYAVGVEVEFNTNTSSSSNCTIGTGGTGGTGGTNPDGGVGGDGNHGMAAPNLQIN